MNAINTKDNASYNFVAPDIESDAGKKTEMMFPTAEVVEPTISSNKAEAAVRREKTIMKLGTLAAACELTLAPEAANLNVGAVVAVSWTNGSTKYDVTVKVGDTTVATLTGIASTTVTKQLLWDGTGFLAS